MHFDIHCQACASYVRVRGLGEGKLTAPGAYSTTPISLLHLQTYAGLRLAFPNAFINAIQNWLRGSFGIAFINAFMNGFD